MPVTPCRRPECVCAPTDRERTAATAVARGRARSTGLTDATRVLAETATTTTVVAVVRRTAFAGRNDRVVAKMAAAVCRTVLNNAVVLYWSVLVRQR